MNGFAAAATFLQSWNRLGMAYLQLLVASNEVIWRRSIEMAAGSMSPAEAVRMFFEKPTAFANAAERATIAVVNRNGPLTVAEAWIRPVGTKAKRNVRRLRRK